ncbi:hypothetical protein SAMN05444416_105125 [Thermoactinomyces sp. DSM 45892]|nr:hypothetical protein SAMN05444416_105125 [Thermoactinomyces sp. DSM 45892]
MMDMMGEFANTYSHFSQQYYLTKQKEPLIQFVLDVLKPYGGKHFEGYVVGKQRATTSNYTGPSFPLIIKEPYLHT